MDDANKYRHQDVEEKWRKTWEDAKLDTPDILQASKPFYNLMMFPYPSAEGLHVGNMYAFTGSDIYGRFKRMQGYDVFEPIGLDGFGIHSENYAFKVGKHPMDQVAVSERRFYDQLHTIGAMYDWSRTVETYDPSYYKWTQWLFVQMFKHGLAFRGKAQVNWCPSCKTVLADEQVIDGACERCGNSVQKRELEQWFFRITAYAEKLLQNSYSLDWSQKVKLAQQRWIGKKEGINIAYEVKGSQEKIVCFTTTPVNFAATFIVLSPEHLLAAKVIQKDHIRDIKRYIEQAKKVTLDFRITQGREKTGVFTGSHCLNHVTGEYIPIWISDFVLGSVGTGAVQGCPGHDLRDFEFAKKFGLPIRRVVVGPDGDTSEITRREQVIEHGPGKMINSGFLNGMEFADAMQKTMDYIEEKGWGKRVITYHLRDWLISRQRYWGPPIPMIFCEKCAKEGKSWFTTEESQKMSFPRKRESSLQAMDPRLHGGDRGAAGWYPVPEKDLPVLLPRIEDYKPGDDPDVTSGPLAKHKEFYETTCPGCGGKAVRETDVSDTFLDSSWYFLRYPSVGLSTPEVEELPPQAARDTSGVSKSPPWDPSVTKKWLPVAMYTGGAEHSVLHLLYSRFVWMALRDWGYLDFSGEAGSRSAGDEPFTTFYAHGLIIKDGAKMSKSRGNVVNPDEYIERYGADSLRLYLMFTGPYEAGGDFRDSAMEGMSRWVQRVWRMATRSIMSLDSVVPLAPSDPSRRSTSPSATVQKVLHRAVKKVGEDIERRRYNTAIAAMMELVNTVIEEGGVMALDDLKDFLKILAPFAPYMTEELWMQMNSRGTVHPRGGGIAAKGGKGHLGGESIHLQPWPVYDPKLLEEDTAQIIVQVNGKLRDTVVVSRESSVVRGEVEQTARASARVAKRLEGKMVKKIVFVSGKLINFVI